MPPEPDNALIVQSDRTCIWAGLPDWARSTFTGFLNHASPLYCWREEQPLRGALVARYGGDMPHISATADCVRYLRHMMAFEDGAALRLMAGFGDLELSAGEPCSLAESPTRFGRVSLNLEPLGRWRGLKDVEDLRAKRNIDRVSADARARCRWRPARAWRLHCRGSRTTGNGIPAPTTRRPSVR